VNNQNSGIVEVGSRPAKIERRVRCWLFELPPHRDLGKLAPDRFMRGSLANSNAQSILVGFLSGSC